MPAQSYLHYVTASMLMAALFLPAQAHEMDGIDHAHLPNGMVQIIEPIPGVASAPAVRPDKAETSEAPPSTQPSGVASVLIQAGLIISAIVLLVVALRASAISGGRRHKQKPDPSAQPSTPIPPG